MQTRSSTHIATRSNPIESNRPTAVATLALVPTPSVDDTRTGSAYFAGSKRNSPPNPPMSPITSGRKVERTSALMASTAASPAPIETPAAS